MNIIFSEENANALRERCVVLELETYKVADDKPLKTFAAVTAEEIPVQDIPMLESTVRNHEKLIENFYKQNWDFCEQMIPHLRGKFGGTLDEFYDHLNNRVQSLKQETLPEDWDGIVQKV